MDSSIGSKVMPKKRRHRFYQKQCHKPFYERAKNQFIPLSFNECSSLQSLHYIKNAPEKFGGTTIVPPANPRDSTDANFVGIFGLERGYLC
jgi:hypothetical protein